jgi:hypothetical protein
MSYAETPPRPKGAQATGHDAPAARDASREKDAARARSAASRPEPQHDDEYDDLDAAFEAEGSPYDEDTDWGRLVTFGAGIVVGALLGAGTALLMAPQSGEETRDIIVRRTRDFTRRTRDQAGDSWSALGLELRRAARHGRRSISRGITRARWRTADTLDD